MLGLENNPDCLLRDFLGDPFELLLFGSGLSEDERVRNKRSDLRVRERMCLKGLWRFPRLCVRTRTGLSGLLLYSVELEGCTDELVLERGISSRTKLRSA